MLRWSFAFLLLALIAGVFGFGGIAAGAASAAKILLFVFLAGWAVLLIGGLISGRSPKSLM